VIRDAFGCVVLVIHHCGWDDTRMRGHSSLSGALDVEICVTRDDDLVTATVLAMRDGPEDTQIFGRKKIVEVGISAKGKALTSVVIEPCEGEAEGQDDPLGKPLRWPLGVKVFRAALVEAIIKHAADFDAPDGPTVRAVDLEKVRAAFYRMHVVSSDDETSLEQRQDSRRKAFSRGVDKAQGLGLIGAYTAANGRQIVWMTTPFEQEQSI